MRFHSSLLSLHRLRLGLEKMARLRLLALHGNIGMAKAKQRELQETKRALRHSNVAELQLGMESAELRMSSTAALDIEEARVAQQLQTLAGQLRTAEGQFIARRREREIVENAIAMKKSAFELETNRREQARVDDEVLQRLTRDRDDDGDCRSESRPKPAAL
jgi:flagellar biosynthesis chaperone FliJ